METIIESRESTIREWKPTPKQSKFAQIPDTVFEGFYGGAAGGGKSELLLMLPIMRGWIKNRNFKGLILRRTFPELEKEMILRAYEYYPSTGGRPSNDGKRWRWPSGAIIDFGHAEHEKDIRKYDTAQYQYIAFDELTSFTQFQYLYMFSRARSKDPSLPVIVRSGSNPGNIGHGWVRRRFVEPCPPGGAILKDTRTGQKRIFIPALLSDNPHIDVNDPNYRWRLEMMPEAERRAKLYGDWWTFSGQVFSDFRENPLPDEPEYARHVIEPFVIPSFWPRILACDWGFSAMTWAGWAAIAPNGRVYLYREYAKKNQLVTTWAADLAVMSYGEKIRRFILDTNAWAHVGQPKTVAQQVEDAVKGFLPAPEPADKDRVGGKVLMQEFIRWKPKPARKVIPDDFNNEFAQFVLRHKGKPAYDRYCEAFQPEKEEVGGVDIPRLQIFNTCPVVAKTLGLCVYEERPSNGTAAEDVAEFDGDDPYDGSRYLIKAVDRYVRESKMEFESTQKEAVAQEFLEQTGDQTGYYRRMATIERGQRHTNSIRLKRGRGRSMVSMAIRRSA